MTDRQKHYRSLSREEISELAGEELPERAATSLIKANVAIPINAAVAADVLSDNATASPMRPSPGRSPKAIERGYSMTDEPKETAR